MTKIDGGLRQEFRTRLPKFDWLSIETGMTEGGVPDSNFCLDGKDGWIEYKKTDGWAITLEPEQVGWLLRRTRHGGRAFVAVRRRCPAGVRRVAADELYLLWGGLARELRDGGLRAALDPRNPASRGLLGYWSGGPSRWSWPEVATVLTRGGSAA
jgi:hypothetical protein